MDFKMKHIINHAKVLDVLTIINMATKAETDVWPDGNDF